MKTTALALLALLLAPAAVAAVRGTYVESRTADVYTGPCFANSEMGLRGKEGIMAWRVDHGEWDGVALAGLGVAAVVSASATLGDPHDAALPARAVLLVDLRATPAQALALQAMARELGGALLQDVAAVRRAPFSWEVTGHGAAVVRAGDDVRIETRCVHAGDHHCGNESVFYPPLSAGVEAAPAVSITQAWQGEGLGGTWSCRNKRSAFVGTFAR
jgi:hypothetical protein